MVSSSFYNSYSFDMTLGVGGDLIGREMDFIIQFGDKARRHVLTPFAALASKSGMVRRYGMLELSID